MNGPRLGSNGSRTEIFLSFKMVFYCLTVSWMYVRLLESFLPPIPPLPCLLCLLPLGPPLSESSPPVMSSCVWLTGLNYSFLPKRGRKVICWSKGNLSAAALHTEGNDTPSPVAINCQLSIAESSWDGPLPHLWGDVEGAVLCRLCEDNHNRSEFVSVSNIFALHLPPFDSLL